MKNSTLILIGIALVGANAFAIGFGTGDSGGGGAFVCRDSKGRPKSAELVDLWESHNVRKNPIRYDRSTPADVQADRAVGNLCRIDTALCSRVKTELAYVRSHFWDLPSNVTLGPPPDVNNGFQKPNCPLEGMLYFDGESQLVARRLSIFNVLQTQTDVAAALTHEAIYKTLREVVGQRDSRFTRRLNSELYQVNPPLPFPAADPAGAIKYRCSSAWTDFDFVITSSTQFGETWLMVWRKFLQHEFGGTAISSLELLHQQTPAGDSYPIWNFEGKIKVNGFDTKSQYLPGFVVDDSSVNADLHLENHPDSFDFHFRSLESFVTGFFMMGDVAHCRRVR